MSLLLSLFVAFVACCIIHVILFTAPSMFSSSSSSSQFAFFSSSKPPLAQHQIRRQKFSTLSTATPLRTINHLLLLLTHPDGSNHSSQSLLDRQLQQEQDSAAVLRLLLHNRNENDNNVKSPHTTTAAIPAAPMFLNYAPKLKGWSFMIDTAVLDNIRSGNNDAATKSSGVARQQQRCVGWKATRDCRHDGMRQPEFDRGCAAEISPTEGGDGNNDISGYCDCGGGEHLAKLSCAGDFADDDDDNDNEEKRRNEHWHQRRHKGKDVERKSALTKNSFTCQDICDRSVLASHVAAAVKSTNKLFSPREKRLLQARRERRAQRRRQNLMSDDSNRQQQQQPEAGGTRNSARYCIGGFVSSVALDEEEMANGKAEQRVKKGEKQKSSAKRCGSISEALQHWELRLRAATGSSNNSAMDAFNLKWPAVHFSSPSTAAAAAAASCREPIPDLTSGVCFCSDGILASIQYSSGSGNAVSSSPSYLSRQRAMRQWQQRVRGDGQNTGSDLPLTCEAACRLGSAAASPSSSVSVSLFLSPTAGATRDAELTLVNSAGASDAAEQQADEESQELTRRTQRLKLVESRRVLMMPDYDEHQHQREDSDRGERHTGEGEEEEEDRIVRRVIGSPDDAPAELRLLLDVEQEASRRSAMLRKMRSNMGAAAVFSFTEGAVAGGGHAGSAVDVKFEAGVQQLVDDAKQKKSNNNNNNNQMQQPQKAEL